MKTFEELQTFESNLLRGSRAAKMFPKASRLLVRSALLVPPAHWKSRNELKRLAVRKARKEAGDPASIMIFIAIAGIIINMIWQWWLHREDQDPSAATDELEGLHQAAVQAAYKLACCDKGCCGD